MMIVQPGWQTAAIQDLTRLLQPDLSVRALVLFGNGLQPDPDLWSDLDLLLVVEEREKDRFHPAVEWLAPLGELYTWDQSVGPFVSVTRACFQDFRRIDCLITTEAALERIEEWPSVAFWKGTRTLFSRSPVVDQALAGPFECPKPGLMTDAQFEKMVNGFRFKGMLAVTKVMRNDLLIALHLALEMVQDCCVLGMLLRDRAEGTAHHRDGGAGNEVVRQLEAVRHPFTPAGILDSLEQAAVAFDDLAERWAPAHAAQRQPLGGWIQLARHSLSAGTRPR